MGHTKSGRIIYTGKQSELVNGAYNPKTKRYYNSSTKKWVTYPVKDRITKGFSLYQFKCFDIKSCDTLFNIREVNTERVLRFIDLLYRRTIYIKSNERFSDQIIDDHVRVYYREFELILGLNNYNHNGKVVPIWVYIIQILLDNDIITYIQHKKSKYNYYKQFYYIRLNDMFFTSKKHRYKIKDSRLLLHLHKQNLKIEKSFTYYNKCELKFSKELTLNIEEDTLYKLANERYESKLANAIEMLDWDILSHKANNSKKELIKLRYLYNQPVNNRRYSTYKDEYIDRFIKEYEDFNISLKNIKEGIYLDNRFSRESYGNRVVNIITNLNRDLRKHLRYKGEELSSVDLRTSYISLLFSFIARIYLYNQGYLEEHNLGDVPKYIDVSDMNDFYYTHRDVIFKREYNINPDKKDYDFYAYVKDRLGKNNHGVKLSRFFIKELVNRVINSNDIFMTDWRVGKYDINDIKKIIFTEQGVKFVNKLKYKDLSNLWMLNPKKNKYHTSKNLNILLVRYESLIMNSMMKVLLNNSIPFISVYDSFMVRSVDIGDSLNILNESIKDIGYGLIFKHN